jgi:hypothetical protein
LLSHDSPSLEIEPSVRLQYGVMGAVLAILVVVPWCLARLSILEAVLLVLATCSVAVLAFGRIGWLGGRRQLLKVLWTGEGDWRLFGHDNESWLATLHPSSQALGTLIWLRFASERGPSQLLLFASVSTPDKRRLRTRLRLQASSNGGGDSGQVSDKKRSNAHNAGDLP